MLSGRCWGVAIDDMVDRGGDAEVLAIGAKDPPRLLRGLATDPKARRSDYEVGSAAWISLLANGGKEEIGPLWLGVARVAPEPEPTFEPVVIDQVVEETGEPAVADEQAIVVDQSEAELPETPLLRAPTVPAIDLHEMSSLDLAVLITARYRTVRHALKAASILADRREWYHLEECADMLCRSYDSAEQRLGLHLIRRYRAADPEMRPVLIGLVRSLARQADGNVAALAVDVLAKIDEIPLSDPTSGS
jgi:hypothetical protein